MQKLESLSLSGAARSCTNWPYYGK